jgi:hypothetical protein
MESFIVNSKFSKERPSPSGPMPWDPWNPAPGDAASPRSRQFPQLLDGRFKKQLWGRWPGELRIAGSPPCGLCARALRDTAEGKRLTRNPPLPEVQIPERPRACPYSNTAAAPAPEPPVTGPSWDFWCDLTAFRRWHGTFAGHRIVTNSRSEACARIRGLR